MVHLSKTVGGIFDSVSFLLKFIFLFNNRDGLFDFKIKMEKPHTNLLRDL